MRCNCIHVQTMCCNHNHVQTVRSSCIDVQTGRCTCIHVQTARCNCIHVQTMCCNHNHVQTVRSSCIDVQTARCICIHVQAIQLLLLRCIEIDDETCNLSQVTCKRNGTFVEFHVNFNVRIDMLRKSDREAVTVAVVTFYMVSKYGA